jgi:inward rectifier potassium channel
MARPNNLRIEKRNVPPDGLIDLYYRLLRLRWIYLLSVAFLVYIGVNLFFGLIFFSLHSGLNPPNLGFWDCCFFSVHTFSTVGYGSISPVSIPVHLVTVIETFIGLVFMALLTGLFFSKFSQPSARFLFTEKILLSTHQGRPALIFRVANVRSNRVMDAEISLTTLFDEVTKEGVPFRRLEDLLLERDHTPVFALSFTAVHYIEPGSLAEKLLAVQAKGENVEFLASVRGLDDTFGQTIHSTKLYSRHDTHRGGQFEDILNVLPEGPRVVDFAKFNQFKS